MQGRIALITGGMGGIGTAIAQNLASKGAKVIVSYNKGGDANKAETWQKEQKALGFDFNTHFVDITDFDSCQKLANDLIQKYGKIEILVNNAGVTADSTLIKMSLEQWQRVININLNGLFNVTRNVIGNMIENQYGRVINISSINGQKGQFGQTNYCASKAGSLGFTKALAYEVAKKGITVNAVSPGYVNTNMIQNVPPKIMEEIIKQIPVGRLSEPMEVANVVGFLASKDAADITGANFPINGGQYMA